MPIKDTLEKYDKILRAIFYMNPRVVIQAILDFDETLSWLIQCTYHQMNRTEFFSKSSTLTAVGGRHSLTPI